MLSFQFFPNRNFAKVNAIFYHECRSCTQPCLETRIHDLDEYIGMNGTLYWKFTGNRCSFYLKFDFCLEDPKNMRMYIV